MRFPLRRFIWLSLALIHGLLAAPALRARVALIQYGVAQSVILTRPSAPGYVLKAAQDLQLHLQKMSGAGDGQSDLAEYLAGTGPRDANSSLRITNLQRPSGSQITVEWPSVAGRRYSIQTTTDLKSGAWLPAAINISATPPLNVYTVPLSAPRAFVRVITE